MLVVVFVSVTALAEAKIVADKLPLLTYADSPVAVYDAPNGKRKGTIPAGKSLVLVKQIRSDGWAYGSYKMLNKTKRVYRWFKIAELQGYAEFENYIDQAASDTDAYRTRSSYEVIGKISSNEDLTVVALRGDKVKVIFKADGVYYRMGWVNKTDLSKTAYSYSDIDDYDETEYFGDYDYPEEEDDLNY